LLFLGKKAIIKLLLSKHINLLIFIIFFMLNREGLLREFFLGI